MPRWRDGRRPDLDGRPRSQRSNRSPQSSVRRDVSERQLCAARNARSSSPRTTRSRARSTRPTVRSACLPTTYNLAAERGPVGATTRAIASQPRQLSASEEADGRHRSPRAVGAAVHTSRPGSTTTPTPSATIGPRASRATARAVPCSIDVGARLTWTISFGGAPRSGPNGPQINIIRGGDADPLRGMPSAIRPCRAIGSSCTRRATTSLNHVERAEFQRRRSSPLLHVAAWISFDRRHRRWHRRREVMVWPTRG